MVISWYGQSSFKIQSGELVIATDPYHKEIGLTPPRFKADIVVVTHEHPDHNNIETIPQAGEAEGAFIVRGPGDYEIKGVTITGIETFHDKVSGKERGANTAYIIELENIRLLHLGDFGEAKLRPETIDALGEIDILLVPVGGTYTIDAEEAAEIASQVEPKVVIPMHYKIPGLKVNLAPVDTFLKEMGAKSAEVEDRLTIKKKDLAEDESAKVVVLKPVNS
ncbi:MAG: MBL fold metallo-hydrolase [Candidatus Sungbacteria bacterium]|uniref:MBL fold metallo-hydrolase n=1 Tax=Candidatus Sungiibacteriota bacterium TaxID=2750080 RepID=A0A9D6LR62_9BACT|nr:MBL fold metallo-hydrolase [Candidatus Sungbacteria bacterium]